MAWHMGTNGFDEYNHEFSRIGKDWLVKDFHNIWILRNWHGIQVSGIWGKSKINICILLWLLGKERLKDDFFAKHA